MPKVKGEKDKKEMGTFADGMGIFLALEDLDRDSITQDHSLSCSRNFFFSGHVFLMVTDIKSEQRFLCNSDPDWKSGESMVGLSHHGGDAWVFVCPSCCSCSGRCGTRTAEQ